jgi:RimJ/RimL family protein N-acetyltransferase
MLASGLRPIETSAEQVRGTLQADACCFLLRRDDETLGFVELRAIRSVPGREDAAAVVWMASKRPIGLGAAALGFILRYAFHELGLREVWGWVGQDNQAMLRLCRRLGIRDNGTWEGDPDFRLMTCSACELPQIDAVLHDLGKRVCVTAR